MDLRAGLVGLGMMGRNHARVMSNTDGVLFVGAVDPAGDQTGALDKSLIFDSVSELIDENIDIAIVACPTVAHEIVALELCEAGIHTLVEKPLAMDIAAAEFAAAENFEPGKRSARKFEYEEETQDSYSTNFSVTPNCENVYNVGVSAVDMSGKVLWKPTDCKGNEQNWNKAMTGGDKQAAYNAVSSAAFKAFNEKTDVCEKSTYTTCGSSVANMPGGGATSDYSVSVDESGAITTTFSVDGNNLGRQPPPPPPGPGPIIHPPPPPTDPIGNPIVKILNPLTS